MLTRKRGLRFTLLLSTLVAVAAVPQAALAAKGDDKEESSAKKKIAVGGFEGAKSDDIRGEVIEALKKSGDYEVTDAEDIKPSAKDAAVAEAAKGLGVAAVVTGKVKKGFTLVLSVRNAGDGSLIEDVEIKGGMLPKLKKSIASTAADSISGPVGEAKAPEEEKEEAAPEEEKPAAEDKQEKPAEEEPSDSGGERLSPLDVTAGLRPYNRTFEFHDTIADVRPNEGFFQLLRYELPLGPALFIDLNWYPAAHFMDGPLTWIGLTGGFEKGFATQSVFAENTADERTLKTDMQAWYVGARFRFPIGEHRIGGALTFGDHRFLLTGDEGNPLIPDVQYTYVKLGINGEFRFGDFLAGARIGKRFVFDTGGLETIWFAQTKTQSLEAGLTLGYRLIGPLDLLVGFDWLRYGFDFNPVAPRVSATPPASDGILSFVAGGAVDQYLMGHIGFRFTLPGSGGGGGAPTSVNASAGASAE